MIRVTDKDRLSEAMLTFAHHVQTYWDGKAPIVLLWKPWEDRRSLSQNSLYRVWCRTIGEAVGRSEADVHDLLRYKFLGSEEVEIGRDKIVRLISTTRLTKSGMGEYMNRIEAWALDLGVMLPMPEDNEYMEYREARQ
jgi:hypothetical protein